MGSKGSEDVAEDQLTDLVGRCMVLVGKKNPKEIKAYPTNVDCQNNAAKAKSKHEVKACRLHDLVHHAITDC